MGRIRYYAASDDQKIYVQRRDISGGMNNRQHGLVIRENQVESLTNGTIEIPGMSTKRKGIGLVQDLGDNEAGTGAFGFEPNGQTNELIVTHGDELEGETTPTVGGGSFDTHKSDFVAGTRVNMLKVGESGEGDVLMVYMTGNNWFRMTYGHSFQDLGDTNTSPPLTHVACYFRNRFWVMKDNELFWPDAFPADFSAAFDRTTNAYNIPCGTEQALIPVRDQGIVCLGSDEVWGINPSAIPQATDKAEKLLDLGCVEGGTATQVGDDVIFLARDGVRGVFRTQQDKLQLGQSFPLSYVLKTEFEDINWAKISLARAIFFDNKYFLALPTGTTAYNDVVWIYFPAYQAWTVVSNWNVADWAKIQILGKEKLYYIDGTDDKVYEAWYGTTDAGTAITYTEIGRKEDVGQPHKKKYGGEINIKCRATGGTLTVYAAFDDAGFVQLGTMGLTGNKVTFPVTFPVIFSSPNMAYAKFPIDSQGAWYYCQLKLVHSDSNDIKVLERNIITYVEEYESDDSA